jgi:hypothetical protein
MSNKRKYSSQVVDNLVVILCKNSGLCLQNVMIDIIRKLKKDTIIEFIIEESKVYMKTNNNSFELY